MRFGNKIFLNSLLYTTVCRLALFECLNLHIEVIVLRGVGFISKMATITIFKAWEISGCGTIQFEFQTD